jgi:hypothetical protein
MGTMATAGEPGVTELVEGILGDARRLLSQQIDLFKEEVREEVGRAAALAAEAGAGAGLASLGGVLAAHAAVHLLHRATRLPLWGCYGLVGGLLGAAGAGLLVNAKARAAGLRLAPPPQTAAALRENVAWLTEQTTGRAG